MPTQETYGFQAETDALLHLVINHLYSNKEIFLRELISNAADAIDKLRFAALVEPNLLGEDRELKIWVDFNKDARTITVRDNGIGMNKAEIIKNLGTIANSGTKEFIKNLTEEKARDSKLIGQFGVGFYASFIVADKVVVSSKRVDVQNDLGVSWSSDGKGKFVVEEVKKTSRGTEVVLHLKEGFDEFLSGWHLRHLITKYSDHIDLPIIMQKEPEPSKEDDTKDSKIIDVPQEEVVNRAKALWSLNKAEITEDNYKELYKNLSHDYDDPLAWTHNKVEGKNEYISLLYIPKHAPFDLYNPGKVRGLKLYVKRVFIMDNVESFLPNYLRFVKGIIDASDLPLNVSRELLQDNKIIDNIKSSNCKRILALLANLAEKEPDKYATFWQEFGQVLKEGVVEDFANKDELAKLLRFSSTHTNDNSQTVSLNDYVARMSSSQDKIYYICADSFNAVKDSPHLEIFRKKGIEVLLLSDRIDPWFIVHFHEFAGKKLQSITKGNLDLPDVDNKVEEAKETEFKDILGRVKALLDARVKDVVLSARLTDSPACIVMGADDMDPQMQKLLKAYGQNAPSVKPILELNPNHILVGALKTANDARFADLSWILLEQAVLAEGGQLPEPANFVHRFNKILQELVVHEKK